jgi:hypothetical protein
MTKQPQAPPITHPELDEPTRQLVQKIIQEEQKLHKHDSADIRARLKIVEYVEQLHAKAPPKGWAELARKAGYLREHADRYRRLYRCWLGKGDARDSALLDKLPSDLEKLDALCKLNREQLTKLAQTHDLRKMPRREVVKLAKGLLQGDKAKAPPAPSAKKVLQAFDRIQRQVEAWRQGGDAATTRDTLLTQLQPRLEQLLQSLDLSPDAEGEEPAEDAVEAA